MILAKKIGSAKFIIIPFVIAYFDTKKAVKMYSRYNKFLYNILSLFLIFFLYSVILTQVTIPNLPK